MKQKSGTDLSEAATAWLAEIESGWTFEPYERAVLLLAAQAWDRLREARAQIDREGITVNDRFGKPRAHPLLAVERDSRLALLRSLRALKFTEASAPAGKLVPIADRQRRVRHA
jgi:phage terminase small subunit